MYDQLFGNYCSGNGSGNGGVYSVMSCRLEPMRRNMAHRVPEFAGAAFVRRLPFCVLHFAVSPLRAGLSRTTRSSSMTAPRCASHQMIAVQHRTAPHSTAQETNSSAVRCSSRADRQTEGRSERMDRSGMEWIDRVNKEERGALYALR